MRFALGPDDKRFLSAAWSPTARRSLTSASALTAALERSKFGPCKTTSCSTFSMTVFDGGAPMFSMAPRRRCPFGSHKGGYSESDLWAIPLDSSGAATGKPVRLTNTTGSNVVGLSEARRQANVDSSGAFRIASLVANLARGRQAETTVCLTNDSWNNWPRAWSKDSQTLFYILFESRGIYRRRIRRRPRSRSPEAESTIHQRA